MIRVGNKVPKSNQTQSMSQPLFSIKVEVPPSLPQVNEDHTVNFARSSTQHYQERYRNLSLQPVHEEQMIDLSQSPSQYFQERLQYHLEQRIKIRKVIGRLIRM